MKQALASHCADYIKAKALIAQGLCILGDGVL